MLSISNRAVKKKAGRMYVCRAPISMIGNRAVKKKGQKKIREPAK